MNHFIHTCVMSLFISLLTSATIIAADLRVEQTWSRATPPNAINGALFASLSNSTTTNDQLVSVISDVANEVQLHTVEVSADGVKAMRQVPHIVVPASSTVVLKPGSFHVMLIGLKRPLVAGEKLPVTFNFAIAGARSVDITIGEFTASGPTAAPSEGACPLCEEKAKPAAKIP